jgi:3-deoxy-D-manno-octulosonic-acid transferase
MNAARALYSLVTWCAQPLLVRKLRRRAVAEPGYGLAVGERFGHYPPPIDSIVPHSSSDPLGRFVWIHAVSLGETRAAAILLGELRLQIPGMHLLLTHGTATGRAEGEKLLQPGDVQVWQPWDTPGAVSRFLRKFRPAIGILMETEVWPNLVEGCRQRSIPLVLANARFNEKSLRKAQRLAALARPAYGGLTAAWAQTEHDAARLRAMGAPVRGVFGNLKFDVVPDAHQVARGRAWRAQSRRPVVMLASSREGEEALWLENFKKKQALALTSKAVAAINSEANGMDAAAVQWLIVPRHPQRFDEVHQLLQGAGLSVSRRSTWAAQPEEADVWLGDSLGEMALYYGLADVALLGGSFAPLGGQNLIEAAACGCPVVLGPHTFNFAEAAELACVTGAAQRVGDLAEGMECACTVAADVARLTQMRARALGFAQSHRGGAAATAAAALALLKSSG